MDSAAELDEHDGPVRGGQERAPLECRFQEPCLFHRPREAAGSREVPRARQPDTISKGFLFRPERRHPCVMSIVDLDRCAAHRGTRVVARTCPGPVAAREPLYAGRRARCLSRPASLVPLSAFCCIGGLAALVAALGGWLLDRARLGASDAEAFARLERETRAQFDEISRSLAADGMGRRRTARSRRRGAHLVASGPRSIGRARAVRRGRCRLAAGRRRSRPGHHRLRSGRAAAGLERPAIAHRSLAHRRRSVRAVFRAVVRSVSAWSASSPSRAGRPAPRHHRDRTTPVHPPRHRQPDRPGLHARHANGPGITASPRARGRRRGAAYPSWSVRPAAT